MTVQKDLCQIFMTPLNEAVRSFIKIIGSGTGLGKTYGAIESLYRYTESKPNEQILAIFTSPQHNQISFPDLIKNKFTKNGVQVIKTKPLGYNTMSDIESDNNVYDVVHDLFFSTNNQQTTLFDCLLSAAREADEAMSGIDNHPNIEQKVKLSFHLKRKVDGLMDSLSEKSVFKENEEGSFSMEENIDQDDLTDEINSLKGRIKDRLINISKNVIKIFQYYYTNRVFRNKVDVKLGSRNLEKFRVYTASYFPFLHYQVMGSDQALIGMVVNKLLTKNSVLVPKYVKKTKTLKWVKKEYLIEEILSDRSELHEKVNYEFALADELGLNDNTSPYASNLYAAEIILFIDESDASKKIITDEKNRNIFDNQLIQSMAANSKEFGDVVYDDSYTNLTDSIPSDDAKLSDYFSSRSNDDSFERQAAKEIIRKIHNNIITYAHKNGWEDLTEKNQTQEDLSKDVRLIALSILSAPYCTVDDSVDRKVFDVTSVFGGENFGFIGSRNINELSVVVKSNSLTIVNTSSLIGSESSVPLSALFLLITISWLEFRIISQNRGSDSPFDQGGLFKNRDKSLDDDLRKIKFECLLHGKSGSKEYSDRFKKKLSELSNQATSSLSSIASAYKVSYHSSVADQELKTAKKLSEGFFRGAFSPSDYDLKHLISDEVESFVSSLVSEVDMHFSYIKGHTIYGLSQIENNDYKIDIDERTHIAFPLRVRKESAESFLLSALSSENRRISCFLMSATGAFENGHIPAWSISSLEFLSKDKNVDVFRMNDDDYFVTREKQKERGDLKGVGFKSLDDLQSLDLVTALFNRLEGERIAAFARGDSASILDALIKLSWNEHKITEAENIFKALDIVHNNGSKKPMFALSLAQTHRNVSTFISLLTRPDAAPLSLDGKMYELGCMLKSGSTSSNVGYGIYKLSQNSVDNYGSRFGSSSRSTLVVFYSAALDKALIKIFKSSISNVNSVEYKLKNFLGMNPRKPFASATKTDFNPMDYLLSEVHGSNVLIISAFGSASRGVNFKVNHDYIGSNASVKKKGSSDKQMSLDGLIGQRESISEPAPITYSERKQERDLDALFFASQPHYSELLVDSSFSKSLDRIAAQKRFFHKCDIYFYYIEWLARNNSQGKGSVLNTSLDLQSPYEDEDAEEYFDQQHLISLVSIFMQSVGRIERTNYKQEQVIYYCSGVFQVVLDGLDAITDGLSNEEVNQTIGAMSVFNQKLIRMIRSGEFESKENDTSNQRKSTLFSLSEKFETLKHSFLEAITMYRSYDEDSNIPDAINQQILFYEVFRSGLLFEEGYEVYIGTLNKVVDSMPRRHAEKYRKIIDMMFTSYDMPLSVYRDMRGRIIDLPTKELEFKGSMHPVLINNLDDRYVYPEAHFIPDLVGNYGEWVLSKVVDLITSDGKIKRLSHKKSEEMRRCYELGDFFLQYENKLLVIDAKSYRSIANYDVRSNTDLGFNKKLILKMKNKITEIEKIFDNKRVIYVIANTSSFETTSRLGGVKRLGEQMFTADSQGNTEEMAIQIKQLMNK